MKKIYFFIVFSCLVSTIHAQTLKRIELPTSGDGQAYKVIPLGKEGILLLSRTGKQTFNVSKYDESLEKVFSINGMLDDNANFIDYSKDGTTISLLFSKSNNALYQIFKVTSTIGLMQKFTFEGIKNFEISGFKVRGTYAYLAGTVKDEPVLTKLSFEGNAPRILSGGLKGTASIQSFEIDSLTNNLNISYSVQKGKMDYIVVKKIDENGNFISQLQIEPEEDLALLTSKLFTLNDSTQLMIGNYGFRGNESNGVLMSQGLYICKVLYNNPVYINYFSFTDFKNFFKYLPEKEQQRIERKIEQKKERGEDLKLNYRILVHNVIQKNNQYIIVAEVFYPEFRYNNAYYGSSFGSPYGFGSMYPYGFSRYYYGINSWAWNPYMYNNNFNRGQIFDGFRYTHAIVAGFNTKGFLVWDNSIGLDELKSMELKEKIKVKVEPDALQLVFSNSGQLTTKIIQGNDVLEGKKVIHLTTQKEGDDIKSTELDDTQYWYDNYYLAWGNQKISNKNEGKRNVFYLSKIAF